MQRTKIRVNKNVIQTIVVGYNLFWNYDIFTMKYTTIR